MLFPILIIGKEGEYKGRKLVYNPVNTTERG